MTTLAAVSSLPERAIESSPQMAKLPWFPRDFSSSTRGWPLVARGAYRELLDCQWDQGSLPPEERELRSLVGATPAEWRSAWRYVEVKFPVGVDGRRRNARLESHRRKLLSKIQAHRQGAAHTNSLRAGRSAG